jgi:hypothetical protein
MPEFEQPEWMRKAAPGGMLNTSVIRQELFFLATIFLASKPVSQFADRVPGEGKHMVELWNELAEHEITLRLASTASFLRARDDLWITEAPDHELRKAPCGTLRRDMESDNVVDLTMREACNKIIHASRYNFDVNGDDPYQYLEPIVYLYGTYGGKNWRAEVDVLRYVETGIAFTTYS